jgi:hypothetical protein
MKSYFIINRLFTLIWTLWCNHVTCKLLKSRVRYLEEKRTKGCFKCFPRVLKVLFLTFMSHDISITLENCVYLSWIILFRIPYISLSR